MSYVNKTGTNIGNCLTGFGIHYPVTIQNSGNGEVFYNIKNSNTTNFSISKSSFNIDPSSYESFDVFYKPTISSGTDETTDLTISSISIEDGSIDPSGDITLNLTGTRLTTIYPGNSRSFRVISNGKKPSYEFYWKAPTGISGATYHNYFITGYTLQLSTNSNFSSIVHTKEINVAENTDQNPKFSSYYGFNNDDLYYELNQTEYSALKTETDYYARIYTAVAGNTGVHIHASGVTSSSQLVSDEVAIGYSGAAINIKIEKQPFNFYVTPDNMWFNYTYDLYSKLIESNLGSTDFSAYSGINIYLPENTVFESQDLDKGAIDLNGKFINLTGSAAGTFINFYIPSTTEIVGRNGNGTNLYFKYNSSSYNGLTASLDTSYILTQATTNDYNDTSNGGPALSLKATTVVNGAALTNIKYNIYSNLSNPQISNINTKTNPVIAGGPGGNKGGFFILSSSTIGSIFYGYDTLKDGLPYYVIVPCNGTLPKNYLLNTSTNRKWWYWYIYFIAAGAGIRDTESKQISSVYSPYIGGGEMGLSNVIYTELNGLTYYLPENNYFKTAVTLNTRPNKEIGSKNFSSYSYFLPINTTFNNRLPGNIINCEPNASINFNLYNNILPSDYIFRFTQAGLSSATSWTGGSYSMTVGAGDAGSYDSNYKNLGYKSLKLNNGKFIKIDFPSSTNIKSVDFDIFFVCTFDDFTDPTLSQTFYTDLFDWYNTSSSDNISKYQFSINQVNPLKYTGFPKENLTFIYKNSCLQNRLDVTQAGLLTENQLGQSFKNWKISKQLYTLLQISNITSNVITTTTNHNLNDGDTIGFTGDTLPVELINNQYDTVSPYPKKVYYVRDKTLSTFKIAATSGGSALTLSSGTGTIHKLKSDTLYRPFILQIRRIDNEYYYFINRKQINSYSANKKENTLIYNLQSTTLKLINRGSIGINYFDCCFYNRLLNTNELDSTYSYLVNSYFKLFSGDSAANSLDLKSNLYSYRLPNIFSIAGKV